MKYDWTSPDQPINTASRPQVIKDELQISQTKIRSESTWKAEKCFQPGTQKPFISTL